MKALSIVAVVAAVALLSHAAQAWPSERQIDSNTYALNANGSIAIEDSSGDVKVTGWDRDSVEVIATKTAWSHEALSSLQSHVQGTPDSIAVRAIYPEHCFNCDISYSIHAPRGAHVTVESASGDVTIGAVSGPIRVESSSGDVSVRQAGGAAHLHTSSGSLSIDGASESVEADTSSGDIDAKGLTSDTDLVSSSGDVKAEFASFSSVKDVRLESSSGDVSFIVPRGVGFRVQATTSSGSIETNLALPVHDRDSGADVAAQVGSGNATVQLRATSGDIHVTMR